MHRIFQERPEILTPVFRALGLPLSEKATVDVVTGDATETRPLARHVDTVLRVGPSDGEDFLLVVCRDRATAKWAAGPFECGTRGWTAQRTYPLVVGPDNLPVIIDARTAAEKPALAAFSALTHANSPDIDAILDALGQGLESLGGDAPTYYAQFLDAALGSTPAGDKWRTIVGFVNYFPGRGTVVEKAYLEGRAEGEARGILRVLEARGISVSEDIRRRVTTCTDLDLLDTWATRAVTVEHAEELFAEGD